MHPPRLFYLTGRKYILIKVQHREPNYAQTASVPGSTSFIPRLPGPGFSGVACDGREKGLGHGLPPAVALL